MILWCRTGGRGMRTMLAKSIEGRELAVYVNFPSRIKQGGTTLSPDSTLIIGGTHGDERATVTILENFIRDYLESGQVAEPTAVISLLNPDGFARNTRYNARGVDLNRNFPHKWGPDSEDPPGSAPLSEPEARVLHDYILENRPAKIVSLHWALAEIDADGPQSTQLAKFMWDALGPEERKPYRLRVHREGLMGEVEAAYCSGSLGQWCGHGLVYPGNRRPAMITLELPYHPHFHPRPDDLPEDHLDSVREHWENRADEYLQAVEGPVHRMLVAACAFLHDAQGNPLR